MFGRVFVAAYDDHIQIPTTLEIVEQIQVTASAVQNASIRRSLLRAGCELTERALREKASSAYSMPKQVVTGR